jgi:hypothetical protein
VICGTITSLLCCGTGPTVAPRCWPASAGNFVTLVTRNPALKTVGDFGPGDRIAVPSVKQGPHSILLGIALEKLFGPGSWNKRDFIQVRMGHNDGALAVLTPSSQVDSHFSTLRNCPGIPADVMRDAVRLLAFPVPGSAPGVNSTPVFVRLRSGFG